MSLLLSLETSSTSCSAAIHDKGRLLAVSEIHEEHAHGAKLASLIKQVVEEGRVSLEQVAGICISSGPGSYTGLRIGTSTAKGLCYSLGIPLISVDSLSAMAFGAMKSHSEKALYCPMLDARRMEVYCAVFSSELEFVRPVQAKVIEAGAFRELMDEARVVFFGNGSAKCRHLLEHPNAVFLENIIPSAREVGELGWRRFEQGIFEDLVHFEPIYLKEFLIKKPVKSDSVLNK
jgi:tRNA threonylcarbamoyladenosine biosynthesis protein TsaB